MQAPLISIIIPVYNVEKYVAECLRSVMTQTRIEDITIECLIVDDCGSDNSMHVVDQTIASYKGPIEFKVLHHSSNKGLSAARNTGIREASGEYLTFIDSDDYLLEDAIYNLFKIARKYPDSEIVQGEIQLSHPNKGWRDCLNVCAAEHQENIRGPQKSKGILLNGMPMTAWAKLVKRNFISENNLCFVEGMIHEDDMWTLEASQYIQNISFCFSPVYYYRQNVEGSIQTNPDRTKSYSCTIDVIKAAMNQWNLHPTPELFEYIYNKIDVDKKIRYWKSRIDKHLISKKLTDLYIESKNSEVPQLFKFMCWYNTLPATVSLNHLLLFIYKTIINHKKNAVLNKLNLEMEKERKQARTKI